MYFSRVLDQESAELIGDVIEFNATIASDHLPYLCPTKFLCLATPLPFYNLHQGRQVVAMAAVSVTYSTNKASFSITSD